MCGPGFEKRSSKISREIDGGISIFSRPLTKPRLALKIYVTLSLLIETTPLNVEIYLIIFCSLSEYTLI